VEKYRMLEMFLIERKLGATTLKTIARRIRKNADQRSRR
jgi:hypothetical protein